MTSARRTRDDIIAQLLRKPTLRNRIDANCVSCIYDDLAPGNWRQQVEDCTLTLCTIHEVRARSRARKHDLICRSFDDPAPGPRADALAAANGE